MTSMAPIRCTGIKQVLLSDDGSAVLLELTMANGKTFPLELESAGIELLTRALLVSAQAIGVPQKRQPLTSTPVSEAIDVPVQALVARPQADGTSALMLRTGCLDLRLALPDDADARNAALEALQQRAP